MEKKTTKRRAAKPAETAEAPRTEQATAPTVETAEALTYRTRRIDANLRSTDDGRVLTSEDEQA